MGKLRLFCPNLPRGFTEQIGQAADMFLACVKVHEVEPQPQTSRVAHRRKPRFSCSHDKTSDFFLNAIGLRCINVRRLPPSARNGELAVGQDREPAVNEQPFQEACSR